jgi:hypothetical protein
VKILAMAKRNSATSVVKSIVSSVKKDIVTAIEEEGKEVMESTLSESLNFLKEKLSQKLSNSTLLGKTVYSLFDVIHDKILGKIKTDLVKKHNLSTEFINDLNKTITEELITSRQLVVDNILKIVAQEIQKHDINQK